MLRRTLISIGAAAVALAIVVEPASAWSLSHMQQLLRGSDMEIRMRMSPRTLVWRMMPILPPSIVRTGFYNSMYGHQLVRTRPSRRHIKTTVRRSSRSSARSFASVASFGTSYGSMPSTFDPESDVSLRGRLVLLGSTSPVLGSANVFSDAEPLDVTNFTVTLTSAAPSVDHLLVYDHDRRFLGTARLDTTISGGRAYVLNLRTKSLVIGQREDYSFYVRAKIKTRADGGASDEQIQISSVTVEGNGFWSNRAYTKTATGTFSVHETARSIITSVTNAGATNEGLLSGSSREIGRFRFAGVRSEGGADLAMTQLTFTVSQVGGVTLSNVQITADGTSDRVDCTTSASTITCSLPESFGSLESGPRVLTLLANVSVPSTASRVSLQISLNTAGDPTTPGAIRWTDGSTTFDWVGFESPVARGTYYSL